MIIDCHVHFDGIKLADRMVADQKATGADRFCIVVTPRTSAEISPDRLAWALWFKRRMPDSVYVFGNLDYAGMFGGKGKKPDVPLVEQLDRLIALGCDGLKMLDGKPDTRKAIGQPLDGKFYTPLLKRLEETRFPLLYHINDPPEFWNPDTVPLWARQQKWWYNDTFPKYQQIQQEALNAFARHPGLNAWLAHFFFLSDDLAVAAEFLRTHPGLCLDLAPGVEMLHNFTRQHAAARELFTGYADRILYGTDIGAASHTTGPKRGWMVRHFLESGDTFEVPDDPLMTPDDRPALHGLSLPGEALAKIYAGNFLRILGHDRPVPLTSEGNELIDRTVTE